MSPPIDLPEEKPAPRRRATTSIRVKKDAPAYRIVVEKFGGLTSFCEITGFNVPTVHNWLRSGLIPSKWYEPGESYQRYILSCAAFMGVEMGPEDFIEEAQ